LIDANEVLLPNKDLDCSLEEFISIICGNKVLYSLYQIKVNIILIDFLYIYIYFSNNSQLYSIFQCTIPRLHHFTCYSACIMNLKAQHTLCINLILNKILNMTIIKLILYNTHLICCTINN